MDATMTMTRRNEADEARWRAIKARDASADGSFVYGVATTGIYCRPSCPSRHARRDNMRLFPDADAAEVAGFRACLRCRPRDTTSSARHAELVTRLCRRIENDEAMPVLADLASEAGLSAFHLHRLFKAATGVTPHAYARACRARRLQAALDDPGASVTTAIYEAGYQSSARFYEGSNMLLGMTPTTYRGGGNGEEIRFAVGQSALGAVLVAMTQKGICAITLGDDPEALVRDLQDRFPRATLIGADPGFESHVAAVVGLVEKPARGLDLPLDIRGTAFQQRVWAALRDIPPGRTASYTEIAQAIGAPTAVRAVAQACGANSHAVAIPCHRVVRNDGALSGYRWGVERKRDLLTRERDA